MPIIAASPRSASSSTIVADLPPSSRKTRFMVAAPFSMIRRPTAVEPVNEIMSTFGDSVSSSPIRWSDDVTMLITPGRDVGLLGDQAAEERRVPRRVRRRLHDHRVARRQGLADLVQRHLDGEVPRDDGADDADRLAPDPPRVDRARDAHRVGQDGLPLELVDLLGRPRQRLGQRGVELRAVGGHHRAADFEDQLLAQLLLLGLQRLVELLEAALAEGVVGRPVGLVEGTAGRVDRPLHLGGRRVGHRTDHLFGGRVDVVEGLARVGLDQLPVNEHPLLRIDLHCLGHGSSSRRSDHHPTRAWLPRGPPENPRSPGWDA